jgi:hypothetical protein
VPDVTDDIARPCRSQMTLRVFVDANVWVYTIIEVG